MMAGWAVQYAAIRISDDISRGQLAGRASPLDTYSTTYSEVLSPRCRDSTAE